MLIYVIAHNPGHSGRYRAGRFWPNGERVRLEVVEDEPSIDPKTKKELRPDPNAPFGADGEPSMEKISRAGYRALQEDGCISVVGDDGIQGEASIATIAALRAQLAAVHAELSDAKLKIASLEDKGDGKGKSEKSAKGDGKGKE